jgi:transposase
MKNWDEWPYSTYNMMVEKVVKPLEIEIITREAQKRLAWFDYYNNNGQNIRKTCRHFGIHHSTFYFWQRRYDPNNLGSLESRSRRPKKVRKPEIPGQIEKLVVELRKEYPAWSKYKLAVILRGAHGITISASSIGRIIKRYGLIEEKASRKRIRAALNPKLRARGTKYKRPGSHVEIDTKHIRLSGTNTYQFTAIDSVTKQRVR